jgi:hypothetical protein
MKDRVDKSIEIVTRIEETLSENKPTEPLRNSSNMTFFP